MPCDTRGFNVIGRYTFLNSLLVTACLLPIAPLKVKPRRLVQRNLRVAWQKRRRRLVQRKNNF